MICRLGYDMGLISQAYRSSRHLGLESGEHRSARMKSYHSATSPTTNSIDLHGIEHSLQGWEALRTDPRTAATYWFSQANSHRRIYFTLCNSQLPQIFHNSMVQSFPCNVCTYSVDQESRFMKTSEPISCSQRRTTPILSQMYRVTTLYSLSSRFLAYFPWFKKWK
jgi:hypothetical protein